MARNMLRAALTSAAFLLAAAGAAAATAEGPRQEELAAACLAGDGPACSEADWDDPASVHLLQRAASARLAGRHASGAVAAGAAAAAEEAGVNATMGVLSEGPGHMTMWSDQESTVVGGACQFANPGLGGLRAGSAASPYIHSKLYCAGNKKTFQSGDACGRCFKLSYDGSHATDAGRPGSTIIQVVDSGASAEFDCQKTAFKQVTGAITGIFPISYTRVPCDVSPGGEVATVLAANPYFMIAIFANSRAPSRKATFIQGGREIPMTRHGSTFSVETGGHKGAVSFLVVNEDGGSVTFNDCFGTWPQPLGTSCSSSGVRPHPHATPAPTPAPTPATPVPTPAPTPAPETTAAPTPAPETTATPTPAPETPTPAPETPTPAPETTTAAPETGTTPAPPPPANVGGCLQRFDQCGGDPAMNGVYSPGTGQRCCASDKRGPLECSLWNGFFSQCVNVGEEIHHLPDPQP